jgi:hypothetical protein
MAKPQTFGTYKEKVASDAGAFLAKGKGRDITQRRVALSPWTDPAEKIKQVYDGKSRPVKGGGKPWDTGYAPPLHGHGGDGDGLTHNHTQEVELQKNQDPVDRQLPGYHNDVALDWRRGQGKRQAEGRPDYDATGNPGSAKGGSRCTANGRDCLDSPFSAAYRKGLGEGF